MTLRGENLIGAEARRGTEAAVRAVAAATGESLEPDFPGASLGDLDRACAWRRPPSTPTGRPIRRRGPASWRRSPPTSWRPATPSSPAAWKRRGCPGRGSRASAPGRWASCACSPAWSARAVPSQCGSIRPCRTASRCPGRTCACAGSPSARWRCSAPRTFRSPSRWRAATPPRPWRRAARWWSRRTRPSRHLGTGRPRHPEGGGVLRPARGDLLAAVRCRPVDRAGAGGRSPDRRRGLHGLPSGRHGPDGDRGRRPVPIPVYAEMSSINPVLLFPGALAARGAEIGQAFAASLTLGAGQFCTNPGLILALPGRASTPSWKRPARPCATAPPRPC